MKAQSIELGTVVCQRSFDLSTPDGQFRSVTVRLGMPVPVTLDERALRDGDEPFRSFRCPFQILGLGHDERIDGAFGEDPFVALQYSIDFIGGRLNAYCEELGVRNDHPRPDGARDSWIWLYPRDRRG